MYRAFVKDMVYLTVFSLEDEQNVHKLINEGEGAFYFTSDEIKEAENFNGIELELTTYKKYIEEVKAKYEKPTKL